MEQNGELDERCKGGKVVFFCWPRYKWSINKGTVRVATLALALDVEPGLI